MQDNYEVKRHHSDERLINDLREALYWEWLGNHDERCDNVHDCITFGGKENCYHTPPQVLGNWKPEDA